MSKFPVFATIVLCFAALILYLGFVLLFYNGNLGAFLIGLFISIILLVWGLKLLKKHDDECKKNTHLYKKPDKTPADTAHIKESDDSQGYNEKILDEFERKKMEREYQEAERLKRIEEQKLNNPKEYERKAELCETIYKEYKDLFKTISSMEDINDKIQAIKECNRKLEVIQTTHYYNGCFRDVDEEIEQVRKKAISILNSYIKKEREEGMDDYMIDIIQFADDLDFISDWIDEKDEKLNNI